MNDLYGEIKFYDYKYPNPIKQIRLIDYFAGIAMSKVIDEDESLKEVVEKSYIIAKMMVEESKKYEDNA